MAPQQTFQDNYQFKYDGSTTISNHVVRFGGEVNKINLGGFANFSGPPTLIGFAPGTPFPSDPLNYTLFEFTLGPNAGFFTPTPAANLPFGGKNNTRYALFGADVWKIRPNFTLNAALRYNYETNFFDEAGNSLPILERLYGGNLADVPDYPKGAFSPQIGFAYDPFGDGKTSVRGGFYLTYENNIFNNTLFDTNNRIAGGIGPAAFDNLANALVGPTGNPIVVNPSAFAGTNIAACQTPAAQAQIATGLYSCLNENVTIGQTLPFLNALNNALQTAYTGFTYNPAAGPSNYERLGNTQFGAIFPEDYSIPYAFQFNIGVQRELAKNLVVQVDYVRNRGIGLPFVIRDLELRRDARTFDEATARARLGALIGTSAAGVNPTAIQNFINTRTAQGLSTNIGTFALANDIVFPGVTRPGTTGVVANGIQRTRIFDGGFSLYQALQFQLNGRFSEDATDFLTIGGQSLAKGLSYGISYALGQSKATDASGRAEFGAGTFNNRAPNSDENFGETPLSRKHILTANASFETFGGVRLDTIIRYRSREALSLTVPALTGLANNANGIFITDINGDGNAGGAAPRPDFLPGTRPGDLGRRLGSVADINAVINNFNFEYAGQLTPAGQRLVQASLFTEAQLRALGATIQPIPLVSEDAPLPFDNVFLTDLRVTRPIKFGERFEIEPSVSIFNLFNSAPLNNGGINGLNGNLGDLNFQGNADFPRGYADPAARAASDSLRGRFTQNLVNTRQIQLGIRFSF